MSIQHASNTLGSLQPVAAVGELLTHLKIRDQVLFSVDAAQSAAHPPINLANWGVDAVAFSGHKMYGPMGLGGLLVKKQNMDELTTVMFGGGMIGNVPGGHYLCEEFKTFLCRLRCGQSTRTG